MRRERRPELMDEPGADVSELSKSLLDLYQVNRWLGGRRTAVRRVLELARQLPRGPVKVLDIGTGGADLPLALARAARTERLDLRITAVDLHPATLAFARAATAGEPTIHIAAADGRDLPFTDGDFDIAMCCTMLHHFDDRDAVAVLREMDRVATQGIVVTDLARSRAALWGARLLANSVWRGHPITRHDGPVSVRGAFTVEELRNLAARAIRRPVRVRRDPLFRLSLIASGSHSRSGAV